MEAASESTFASLMDDEFEEDEYDEDQEVIRVDATQEIDESLLVSEHQRRPMEDIFCPILHLVSL